MRWILRKKKGGMVKEEGGINENQEYGVQGGNNPAVIQFNTSADWSFGFLTSSSATRLPRRRVIRLTSDNFTSCYRESAWRP